MLETLLVLVYLSALGFASAIAAYLCLELVRDRERHQARHEGALEAMDIAEHHVRGMGPRPQAADALARLEDARQALDHEIDPRGHNDDCG